MGLFRNAIDKLRAAIARDEVVRHKWAAEKDGRVLGCLLATMAPECGVHQRPGVCPAYLMPAWLAHLTPWFDDAGSYGKWRDDLATYADLLGRSERMTDDDWRALERAMCVKLGRMFSYHDSMLAELCAGVSDDFHEQDVLEGRPFRGVAVPCRESRGEARHGDAGGDKRRAAGARVGSASGRGNGRFARGGVDQDGGAPWMM